MLSRKTHVLVGEKVTLLECANMSGTEKRLLLVINKFQWPRCFSGVANLPTEYKGNKNAWITSVVFEE